MKPTTKESIKQLTEFVSHLKKLDKKGRSMEIDSSWSMVNTGIREKPASNSDSFQEYIDLGGRSFDCKITVNIPNYKSMLKEMKKIHK